MKKSIFAILVLAFVCFSCLKKEALKYDPDLVGTWVSNSDSVDTWLIVHEDGEGIFSSLASNEKEVRGLVRYSLFEGKMYIGKEKFKVEKWLTGVTDGVSSVKTKEYLSLKDTTYYIDMKMVLRTSGLFKRRIVEFYRVHP